MNQPTNKELLEKLEALINKNSVEIKLEIKSVSDSINQKLNKLEEKYRKIEEKVTHIERANRKNNIVIYGIQTDKNNLLKTTLSQLNEIFECNLVDRDINNIYLFGHKKTIVVEFISFLQKKNILKQLYKLKGTGISISHDLRPEDQQKNKILVKHLKEAKAKNQKTYIKNFKLYVNGVAYSVEELENPGENVFETDPECILPYKNNSAPATPTINRDYSEEFAEPVENNINIRDTRKPEAKRQTDTEQRTQISSDLELCSSTPNRNPANSTASTSNSSKKNANHMTKIKDVKESRVLRNKKSVS